MKKYSYYQTMYRRRNIIAEALLNFFLGLSSWPRMLLEIPIRRNFGERYFSFSGAFGLAFLLALVPFFMMKAFRHLRGGSETGIFFGHFLTWYAYLAFFLYMAVQRRDEIKRLPSVFNFKRFSLSTDLIHPFFLKFEINGRRFDVRTIETLIEPGFFFLIGFILWMSEQPIGLLMVISSIFYSFSYIAAYRNGDNYLMDRIDEKICNEELANTFMDGPGPDGNRGVNFYGRRPADPDARRRLADMFLHEEEIVEAL